MQVVKGTWRMCEQCVPGSLSSSLHESLETRLGPDWIPGTITEVLGPVTYLVDKDEGHWWKRHGDQIKGPIPRVDLLVRPDES